MEQKKYMELCFCLTVSLKKFSSTFTIILVELNRALQMARINHHQQTNQNDTHQKRHPGYPTIKEAHQHERQKQKKIILL